MPSSTYTVNNSTITNARVTWYSTSTPIPYSNTASYTYTFTNDTTPTSAPIIFGPYWEMANGSGRSIDRQQEAAQEAEDKARELLLSCLDDEQRADYEAYEHFHVQVRNKRYRITKKRVGNVYRIEEGRTVESICIHPSGGPLEDQMLSQKLMLETDEERFLRIGNRTDRRGLAVRAA